jgi:TetR/AcrR family transcriptional repressor of nem operon
MTAAKTTAKPITKPGRRHGETRDRILDAAQRMVQTDSYDGFSFRDVAAAVGIRKASVYHHFETKEQLAAAMTDRAGERFRHWAAGESARAPLARLQDYCFDLYGQHLGAGHRLCPGASLVAGWSHLSSGVRESVLALMAQHLEFLAEAMREGAAAGTLVLPARRDPESAAKWFAATVQGALVWARAAESADEFEQLCRITLTELARSS